MEPGSQGHVNPAMYSPADPVASMARTKEQVITDQKILTVAVVLLVIKKVLMDNIPGSPTWWNGPGSPKNVGTTPGVPGSGGNPTKPRQPVNQFLLPMV